MATQAQHRGAPPGVHGRLACTRTGPFCCISVFVARTGPLGMRRPPSAGLYECIGGNGSAVQRFETFNATPLADLGMIRAWISLPRHHQRINTHSDGQCVALQQSTSSRCMVFQWHHCCTKSAINTCLSTDIDGMSQLNIPTAPNATGTHCETVKA